MSDSLMHVVDCKEADKTLPNGKSLYYVLIELSDGRRHNQIYTKPYENGFYEPIHRWKEVLSSYGNKFNVCEARLGDWVAVEIE